MNRAIFSLTFFSMLLSFSLHAQDNGKKVLLTGVVLTGDPLVGVANTNIIVSNKNKGTASDDKGYFSFYTEVNDTLIFSAIGLKSSQFIVPENMDTLPK